MATVLKDGGWSVETGVSRAGRETGVTLIWRGAEPPVTPADLKATYKLSPAQARIALLLHQRFTNAEIAEALGIRPSTVRGHVEIIMLKLGLKSRNEVRPLLDAFAVENGVRAARQLPHVRRQESADSRGSAVVLTLMAGTES